MQRGKYTAQSWVWVFFIALILSAFVWLIRSTDSSNQAELAFSGRTYTIASAAEERQFGEEKIAVLPSIFDAKLTPPESTWIDYRSRTSTSSLAAVVEPRASVTLMAPTPEISQEQWLADLKQSQSRRYNFVSTDSQFATASTRLNPSEHSSTTSGLLEKSSLADQAGLAGLWPLPQKLISELESLHQLALTYAAPQSLISANQASTSPLSAEVSDVAGQVMMASQSAKDMIHKFASTADCCDETLTSLQALESIADQLLKASSQGPDIHFNEAASRAGFSIKRRTQLWLGVYRCLESPSNATETNADFSREELGRRLAALVKQSESTGDVQGWRKYLLVSEFENIANQLSLEEFDIYVARQFLDRINWRGVNAAQRAFLDSREVRQVAEYVQPLAIKPIDYRSLLSDFETLENNSLHRCSATIISTLQSLRYSDNAQQIALGETISTYYRNANIRMAVSAELINRFLPESPQAVRPVQQNILGARTTGGSVVQSRLNVELVPDKSAWHVQLRLNADINSKTASAKWPAVVHSASQTNVISSRSVRITTDMLKVSQGPHESVRSSDHVRDVETDFDSLPLISDVVRYFVDQQVRDQRPVARRITQTLVKNETNKEFDLQLDQQLRTAETRVQDRVIKPLQFIGIDTDIVDLQTTDSRLIARYRIAAFDSLAANTPRPQAPSDSVLSLQIHQSAINNTLNQLKLGSKEWKLPDLMTYLAERMNIGVISSREDLPENVTLQFEELHPICVEFVDDQILLALRIAKLKEPGRIDLNHFVIRVTYGLEATGISADLVRTGAISVDGERLGMRDRLPLRAIFGRVFAAHARVPLIKSSVAEDPRLANLAVSQVVSREGWIALAISPEQSPHVAIVQPNLQTKR